MEIPIDLPSISSSNNSSNESEQMLINDTSTKIDEKLLHENPIDMTIDGFAKQQPSTKIVPIKMITENDDADGEIVDSTTIDVIKEPLTTKSIDELVKSNELDVILN